MYIDPTKNDLDEDDDKDIQEEQIVVVETPKEPAKVV